MALENLYNAVSTLVHALNVQMSMEGIGYYLALIGLGIFLIFTVGIVALVITRVIKRIADMTPGEFLKTLFILAGILIFLGALIP